MENDQIGLATENQDQMEELDLTPYLDDEDDVLHQKLVYAKRARKQAEDDLRLLMNRIGLLKSEEGKALRKIDETRKKTGSVIDQKLRNDQALKEKMHRSNVIRQQEEELAMRNRELKEEQYHRISEKKAQVQERVWTTAMNTKETKEQVRHERRLLQGDHEAKAAQQNMMIRQQRLNTADKREQNFMIKQEKGRQVLEEKMRLEENTRIQHEQDILTMEQQENELIQRLKNTQQLVNDANSELERAHVDPNPDPVAYRKVNSRQGVRVKPPSSSSKAMRR